MKLTDPIKNLRLAMYPLGDVTQWFGVNGHLYSKEFGLDGHNGIDIVRPWGEHMYAVEDGFIGFADVHGGYGKQIKLFSKDLKREWTYGHCSEVLVVTGQEVKAGQHIANMGNTGFVVSGNTPWWGENPYAGTHLHLGLRLIEPKLDGWSYPGSSIKIDVLYYGNGYKGAINPLRYLRDPRLLSSKVEESARRLNDKIWLLFSELLRKINL